MSANLNNISTHQSDKIRLKLVHSTSYEHDTQVLQDWHGISSKADGSMDDAGLEAFRRRVAQATGPIPEDDKCVEKIKAK